MRHGIWSMVVVCRHVVMWCFVCGMMPLGNKCASWGTLILPKTFRVIASSLLFPLFVCLQHVVWRLLYDYNLMWCDDTSEGNHFVSQFPLASLFLCPFLCSSYLSRQVFRIQESKQTGHTFAALTGGLSGGRDYDFRLIFTLWWNIIAKANGNEMKNK